MSTKKKPVFQFSSIEDKNVLHDLEKAVKCLRGTYDSSKVNS